MALLRRRDLGSRDTRIAFDTLHAVSLIAPALRAKPRQVLIVAELPKTRSGKIMRRLLRDVAEHRELGDVTTLTDSSVMDLIGQRLPEAPAED